MSTPSKLSLLPPELLTTTFSFLSTPSLAKASSICQTWRNDILSNPTLHTQVDLSQIARTISSKDYIQLLERLSTLSRHRLTHITLDLSVLLEPSDWDDVFWKPDSGIYDILPKSKASLVELNLKMPRFYPSQNIFGDLTQAVIVRTFSNFNRMFGTSLRTINLSIDFGGSFQIQSQDGKRTMSVRSYANHPNCQVIDLVSMIESAIKAAGNGRLTQLMIPQGGWNQDLLQRFFNLLSNSKSSLVQAELCLSIDVEEFFKALAQCPELTSLSLNLLKSQHDEQATESVRLSIPGDVLGPPNLKKVSLKIEDGFEMEWDSFKTWIVGGLEEFSLEASKSISDELRRMNFKNPSVISGPDLFDILSKFKESLSSINLAAAGEAAGAFKISKKALKETTFSQLKNLKLNSVAEEIYDLFSQVHLPELMRLEVNHTTRIECDVGKPQAKQGAQLAFDFLLRMFMKQSNQLTFIKVDFGDSIVPSMPFRKPGFSFESLEELSFGPKTIGVQASAQEIVAEWFTQFDFPRSRKLHSTADFRSKFLKVSPLLPENKIDEV